MGASMAIFAWFELPILIVLLLPLVWPGGSAWVVPVALRLVDASPAGPVATVFGLVNRGDPIMLVVRMIAYEVAIGVGLVAWAILRLRPVCHRLADADSRALLALRRRAPRRRPACGADAMLWKELHATHTLGLGAGHLLAWLVGGLGLGSLYFARYALLEVMARGYGAVAGESVPGGALEWAVVLAGRIPLSTGQARGLFNLMLREITLVSSLTFALVATEAALKGITQERDQDTLAGDCSRPRSLPGKSSAPR